MRTMRHPDLLRYLDGIENDQAIMFVTDPIEPLSNQLGQDPDSNLVLWGLYKVANAIKFINHDCDMVHGNIRVSSIFTNKAGEWKLGGFELLCSMKDESPISLTFGGLVPEAQKYATPEIKKSGWTIMKDLPVSATDSYHLGCLIYEAYNLRFDTIEQLSRPGNIPANMVEAYKALLRQVMSRADAATYLEVGLRPKSFFDHDFVKVNLFLENISIKEQSEKEGFFRKLDTLIDTFPGDFSKYKILPELVKAFEFGSGGAKALNAIIKIGHHLQDKEYEEIIVGPITRMFASPDRAIRVSLLENMPKFIDHIPAKAVATQIFPNVATGFTDTVPLIREHTIKSVLLLVPKLSDKIINYELLKYLAKLQMDDEPGIRTNTTICLGKIARHLEEGTRKKVLVPAFTRSLRDGFHHARIAALMALAATSEYYDAQDCSTRIVPCVSLVLIDKEKPVRVQAFKTMTCFINRLQDFADHMPDTAIVPQQQSAASPAGSGTSNGSQSQSALSPNGTQPESSMQQAALALTMSGVLGGATKGLAGWAVSSIGARFASPVGDIASPPAVISTPSFSPTTVENSATSNQLFKPQPAVNYNNNSSYGVEEEENGGGWGDDEPLEDLQDTWEPLETAKSEPLYTMSVSPKKTMGSFGSTSMAHKAGTSMQLGGAGAGVGGSKKVDYSIEPDTDSFFKSVAAAAATTTTTTTTTTATTVRDSQQGSSAQSVADRKAEMERRRDERRLRLAELRDKKKSGIGAKKI
ncbi:armadillo-type protein [Phycomyces blakesleeanus]